MVTFTSAVRSNLLSLQDISGQQAITQNRLSTGKKVSSALDNASSFFTAQSFTARAASLAALQDSIATGVQTLQSANNGITTITSLVSQLRSTAQQALQSTSAYSSVAKITSSTALNGASAADIRGNGSATSTADLSTLTSRVAGIATSSNTLDSALAASKAANSGAGEATKTIVIDDKSGNLVNADLNEEAANQLALSTSQSLAQQALTLSNQANQAVLQLLR